MSPERHKLKDPDYRLDNEILFERALKQAKEGDYVIVMAGTDGTTASENMIENHWNCYMDRMKKYRNFWK